MTTQALPALIALLFKFILLAYALRSPRRDATTRLFVLLLVLFAIQNMVEFVGFNHLDQHGLDRVMELVGYTYFAATIPFVAVTLHLSLRLSVDQWHRIKHLVPMLYLPVPILEYLLLGTNQLVAGFQLFQGYTLLRVPGPWYFLFETYLPLYLLAALAYLIYGARGSRPSAIHRIRNRLWLFGLLPFVLLHAYLIVANHFGLAKISSTISVPITLTFFLVVTTYATHQYRLFDIEFFLPWSKVRKRKTAFYARIQSVIAEIAEMRSVREILDCLSNALHCQVALVGGPRTLAASAPGQQSQLLLSQFPLDALQKVDQIVVARELADVQPQLYALMNRYKVGAIVPFNSHSAISAHWMLLGEHFSDNVYTPLDFKVVETLFGRIAERFLDNLTLLRSQLAEANGEALDLQRRLAIAWNEQNELRRQVQRLDEENRNLRIEKAQLLRQTLRVVGGGELPEELLSGRKTLDQYLTDYQVEIVSATLERCHGNKAKAARILGMWPSKLDYLIERHGLSSKWHE